MSKIRGVVKFFKKDRGFGFIIGEDDREYFAHVRQVENTEPLIAGENVYFMPVKTGRGIQAHDIRKVD